MITPLNTIFLSVLFVLSFLYTRLNIMGVGVPVLLVAALLGYAAFSGKLKFTYMGKVPSIKFTFFLYLFYCMLFFAALYLSSSLASEDVRYFVSILLQVIWFPAVLCFLIYRRAGLHKVLKIALTFSGLIVVAFWLIDVMLSGDFFTLRNGSGILSSSDIFVVPHVFSNPNLAGRAILLLLVCSMYFGQIATDRRKAIFWRWLSIFLTLVIISTLSRAVITGTIALWLVVIIMSDNKSSRIFWYLLAGLIVSSVISVTPEISERIDEGLERVSEVRLGFGTEELSVRDTTIRGRTWAASIQIIRDNLLAGIGVSKSLDTLQFYGAVHHKTGEETAIWVHGGFLKQALYSGMLGLLSFLLLYFYLLKSFYVKRRRSMGRGQAPRANPASVFGLSLMVALVPVNLGADSFGFSMTWFVLAFFLCESQVNWKK